MIIFIPIIFFEGTLSFFIKAQPENCNIVSIIFISINTLLILFVLSKNVKDRDLFFVIVIGYIIRVFIVFVDIFIIRIPPHSGSDTELFQGEALTISSNLSYMNEALGGMYAKFLGIFYYIFGPQRIMAQYFNTILGISMITTLISILEYLNIENRQIKIAVIIITFFPQNMIFSSILLRETLVGTFFLASIKYFILWFSKPRASYIILSTLFIACGSMFHSAIIPAFIIYVFIYSLYSHKDRRIAFNVKSIIILGLFCVLISIAYFKFNKVLFGKFGDLTSANSLVNSVNTNFGGSAYLTNVKLDNLAQVLIFTPIKTLYFLFSPMIWNIRGMQDIISVLMDSVAYLYMIYYIFRHRNDCTIENKIMFYSLIIAFILDAVTLGLGTFTAGTAIRHRNKIFPLLIIIYTMAADGWRKKERVTKAVEEEGNYAKGEYHSTYIQS